MESAIRFFQSRINQLIFEIEERETEIKKYEALIDEVEKENSKEQQLTLF
jgi:prefoldin subunit 5